MKMTQINDRCAGTRQGSGKTDLNIPEDVLAVERAFFDQEAAGLSDGDLLIPDFTFRRYRNARIGPANIPKDTMFAVLQPLEGKQVLDYCCGYGENACLLAGCGARVTAFDLSQVSIEKARRRAELHGLADRIQFDVCAAGRLEYEPASFDAVVSFAALHHLHFILPSIFTEIARLLRPGGTACFVEPMANSPALSFIRRLVPVALYATEHERQLRNEEFEPLRQHFSSVEVKHYLFMERLHRVFEHSKTRRFLRKADHYSQRVFPFLRRFYGEALVIAR